MNIPLVILIVAVTQIGGVVGGLLLIWKERLAHRLSSLLLSFAAGTLLGVAFLDLLPETAEKADDIATVFRWTLLGILLFFLFEKLLLWHHHAHHEADDAVADVAVEAHLDAPALRGKHIRPLVLFGDGLHNALDGVTLAVTFSLDWRLGMLTALAVLLHEVPHNISDFAVLLHTRMQRSRVLWWNFALALPSPIAALITLAVLRNVSDRIITILLSVAAGSFLYIALANLMPEIHHERERTRILLQIALFALGIFVMWQLGKAFPE